MNLTETPTVMRVASPGDLDATNSIAFRELVRAQLRPEHSQLELDLTATRFLDSSGVGALLALGKTMQHRGGRLCVLNATPSVSLAIRAMRLHQLVHLV